MTDAGGVNCYIRYTRSTIPIFFSGRDISMMNLCATYLPRYTGHITNSSEGFQHGSRLMSDVMRGL